MMKKCKMCLKHKLSTSFYRHSASLDGLMYICKECHKECMRINRLTNSAVQVREVARAKKPHRRVNAQKMTDRWRRDKPDAYKAKNALNNALRDGKIVKRPCQICGSTKHLHARHRDYSNPLDVVWLCARCNHRIHAAFPELKPENRKRKASGESYVSQPTRHHHESRSPSPRSNVSAVRRR